MNLPSQFADPLTYQAALERHGKRSKSAYDTITALSERGNRDWTERVREVEDEDEDDHEDEEMAESLSHAPATQTKRKWTVQETTTFERTGILPS